MPIGGSARGEFVRRSGYDVLGALVPIRGRAVLVKMVPNALTIVGIAYPFITRTNVSIYTSQRLNRETP